MGTRFRLNLEASAANKAVASDLSLSKATRRRSGTPPASLPIFVVATASDQACALYETKEPGLGDFLSKPLNLECPAIRLREAG